MDQPTTVAIIDYQMGNLRSVSKAIAHVGGVPMVTDQASEILNADAVILPGVGGFKDAIHEIRQRDLAPVISDAISSGKPFLGICLGLQMLFETSDEGGLHPGLGILPGKCVRFDVPSPLKVPHMGWNTVQTHQPENPLTESMPTDTYFYFVHSYYVEPANASDIWLTSDYGGRFCAAIARGNLFATQFHPEKSQKHGLALLRSFVGLATAADSLH